ncbi:histidinol-phosphatase, partial [bacterium]|nr:histidinol-phosphatase [bacterium]
IASHVDRESFGIIGHLGFIPEGLRLDALELSGRVSADEARAILAPRGQRSRDLPLVTFSDAHYPEDVGKRWTTFLLDDVRVEEIRSALVGGEGRSYFLAE